MDQLICASLSHTHYWYEVGMLKTVLGDESCFAYTVGQCYDYCRVGEYLPWQGIVIVQYYRRYFQHAIRISLLVYVASA